VIEELINNSSMSMPAIHALHGFDGNFHLLGMTDYLMCLGSRKI